MPSRESAPLYIPPIGLHTDGVNRLAELKAWGVLVEIVYLSCYLLYLNPWKPTGHEGPIDPMTIALTLITALLLSLFFLGYFYIVKKLNYWFYTYMVFFYTYLPYRPYVAFSYMFVGPVVLVASIEHARNVHGAFTGFTGDKPDELSPFVTTVIQTGWNLSNLLFVIIFLISILDWVMYGHQFMLDKFPCVFIGSDDDSDYEDECDDSEEETEDESEDESDTICTGSNKRKRD